MRKKVTGEQHQPLNANLEKNNHTCRSAGGGLHNKAEKTKELKKNLKRRRSSVGALTKGKPEKKNTKKKKTGRGSLTRAIQGRFQNFFGDCVVQNQVTKRETFQITKGTLGEATVSVPPDLPTTARYKTKSKKKWVPKISGRGRKLT